MARKRKGEEINILDRDSGGIDDILIETPEQLNQHIEEQELKIICSNKSDYCSTNRFNEDIETDEIPSFLITIPTGTGPIDFQSVLNFNEMMTESARMEQVTDAEKEQYITAFNISDAFNIVIFTHGKKNYNNWIFNLDQMVSSFYFAKNGDIAISVAKYIAEYSPEIIHYLSVRPNTILTPDDSKEILDIIKNAELRSSTVQPSSGDVLDLDTWLQRLSDRRTNRLNIGTIGEYERIGKIYLLFPKMFYTSKYYSVSVGDSKPRGILVCKPKFGNLKKLLNYLCRNSNFDSPLLILLKKLKDIHDKHNLGFYSDHNTYREIQTKTEKYEVLNFDELSTDPNIIFRIPLYFIQCKNKKKSNTQKYAVVLSEILFFGNGATNIDIAFLKQLFDSKIPYDTTYDTIINTYNYDADNFKLVYYKNMNLLCCILLIEFIETLGGNITKIDQVSLTSYFIELYLNISRPPIKIITISENMLRQLFKSYYLFFCNLLDIKNFIMADFSCESAVSANTITEIKRAITVTATNPSGNTNIVSVRGGSKNKKRKNKYKKRKTQKKRKRKTNKKRKHHKFIKSKIKMGLPKWTVSDF
jgi:hypothetical protein